MSRPPVADQAERDRLVDELRTTLFVEAGAGTGKTTAVVSPIVAMVASGGLRMERLTPGTVDACSCTRMRPVERPVTDSPPLEIRRSCRPTWAQLF